MALNIRRMTLEDLDRVYEIELSAHIAPWTKGIIRDCIKIGYDCFVIEKSGRVHGFAIMRVLMNECHLLNICISPRMQGKRLGESLLLSLIEWAQAKELVSILLEVRPSNEVAKKMYKKHQFTEIAHRKNYYQNPDSTKEDALVLTLLLD
jgi:ribosomal-protein-alanine N-acetyltransferase